MTVKIDKGVPVPKLRQKYLKYPWKEMNVGDSFFIPDTTSGRKGGMMKTPRSMGMKIVMRNVTENGVKGVRVWRIE